MARSKSFGPPPKTIGIREQAMFIRMRLPGFKTKFNGPTLIATGDIQPGELCKTYRVRLEYRVGRPPRVRVLSPALQTRGEEQIPHMYLQKHLCLYLPWGGFWGPDMELAKTIIPWASLWLYYYELWHATGEWLGGGHQPGDNETIHKEENHNERAPSQTVSHPEPRRRRNQRRLRRGFPR